MSKSNKDLTQIELKDMTESKKILKHPFLNPPLQQIILTPPSTIKGSKKEKITYCDIICNGKKGIYLNFNSKTPEHKPTLFKFNDKNMYIYIKYTEELETAFMEIIDNMDVESSDLLQDKFLISGVLEKYKDDGFIKVKVDIHKFGKSFFQQIEEGKKGKKVAKNIPYEDFENENIITDGVYSLKIGGVWRKENSTSSGFSIRVLAVLVNSFYKSSNEEEENDDTAYQELLKSRCDETINI